MFCAVGKTKISEEARAAIAADGGTVKDTEQPDIAAAVMPGATITSSDTRGAIIQLRTGVVLYFARAWETEGSSLDIVK